MELEYFPPKKDVILKNEAPIDFYIVVTRAAEMQDIFSGEDSISVSVATNSRFEDKEVQRGAKLVPCKIVDKDGKPYILVKIQEGETKVLSPEEISTMILTKKLKETVEAYLGKQRQRRTSVLSLT